MFSTQSYRATNAWTCAFTCIKVHLLTQFKEILFIAFNLLKGRLSFTLLLSVTFFISPWLLCLNYWGLVLKNFVGVFFSKSWRVYPILSAKSQGYTKCAVDSSWIIQLLIYCHLVRRSTRLAVSSPEPRTCRFI